MKNIKSLVCLSALVAMASLASAQTFSPTLGQGASLDQQVIGDTIATADRTQSTSNQLGNSANQLGNSLGNNVDTRDQNTVTSTGGAATGGAAIGNQSDNKSNASNGNQTLGQVTNGNSSVGNTSSNSGGNTLGGASANTGPISNQNVSSGGAGGKGGEGGSASSNGTNTSTNANTAAQGQGQGQGQQQANNGTNAQGQTSANRNSQRTETNAGNGAGASAGAGAGSNNRTAMTVDASDRSSTSYVAKSIALPPVLHGQAAPPLASASMTVIPGVCGPRHYTETVPVKGTHHGILWDSSVAQGNDYTAVPATTPFIEKDGYLIGHVLNEFVAVVGTSSSKSISGWGVGREQNGGGGGAANSGSHQQIVVRITIKDCLMPVKPVEPPAKAPAVMVVPAALPPKADRN